MAYKIGVDVGGTFTDFLLVGEEGGGESYKVMSTPKDPSIGVINGLREMATGKGLKLEAFIKQVEIIVHGTTVTTNAVLTERGCRCGLLTTKGFRDALQMRRGTREELYNNKYQAPTPLVPRYLRWPVQERVDYQGRVITPLNEEDVRQGLEHFMREGVEAVAICFLHSYANPIHEMQAAKLVAEKLPQTYLTLSTVLLPQIRFYDRISTTALNCYVGPILRRYLTSLTERLAGIGFQGVLLIMQSNGGVMAPQVAIQRAASTLLSGPASGPVAGLVYASVHGYDDCITIDMGGTSFDAALVKDRQPLMVTDGTINRHRLALPMVGIHTIGAGGGSIGWIDEGGLLRMGPQSAGADPGPACYGLGGEHPTSTDADLLLGYLNPDYFLGGRMPLDRRKAEEAVRRYVAQPLGMEVIEAAGGMYQVINVNMAAGVKEVSVERGLDPRDFPLVVAGGAGPIHAGMIALDLEIPVVIIPKESSIFCAAGMLLSDLKHDFVRTYTVPLMEINLQHYRTLFVEMEEEGRRLLQEEQVAAGSIRCLYSSDMRYVGQYHEVNVALEWQEVERGDLEAIGRRFHAGHNRLYGYSLEQEQTAIEVVNLRVTCIGETDKPRFREEPLAGGGSSGPLKGRRPVYLPRQGQFAEVAVFDGTASHHGHRFSGPAIIEQVHTTIFVPPEYDAVCDRFGSYLMFLKGQEPAGNLAP